MAPLRRQDRVEGLANLWRKNGQFPAAAQESVGGQNTGSSGIRDDCEASPRRSRLFGQHIRHREQIRDAVHPKHAGSSKRRVQHLIAAGQRTGMRCRRLRSRVGSPRLDYNDWLIERNLARGREKRPRIPDRLHVNQDALRARIITQIINQIAPVHIQHRPR